MTGQTQQNLIEHFDCRWIGFQTWHHRIERLIERVKGQHPNTSVTWFCHNPQLCRQNDRQCAFGASNHAAQVESFLLTRWHKRCQIIATDSPQQLWVTMLNFCGVFAAKPHCGAVGSPFQAVKCQLLFQRLAVQVFERGYTAIGQQHTQRQHMVAGFAKAQRIHARRIIGNHTANGGAITGRHFGREHDTVAKQQRIQFVEHHSRFDPGIALIEVQFQQVAHMAREIEVNACAGRLPGQTRRPAARRDCRTVAARNRQRRRHIGLVQRHDHCQRRNLINTGVGGIQRPRHIVAAHIAAHRSAQIINQRRGRYGCHTAPLHVRIEHCSV